MIFKAFVEKRYDEVERLILSGVDVNEKDGYDWTPIHWACLSDNERLVELLLQHGAQASVNTKDVDGWTPLHLACDRDNEKIVALLLKYGAKESVNEKANDGWTPYSITASQTIKEMLKPYMEVQKITVEFYCCDHCREFWDEKSEEEEG